VTVGLPAAEALQVFYPSPVRSQRLGDLSHALSLTKARASAKTTFCSPSTKGRQHHSAGNLEAFTGDFLQLSSHLVLVHFFVIMAGS
jgi:hypothetical protein